MNLRDLEYLVAVADHRHFGKAAAACGVSQPTLSAQVKKIENELAVVLIERTSGGHFVTEVGARIVAHARTILREADALRAVAEQARAPRTGRLSLGIFPTLAPYLLPHVLPGLTAAMPGLALGIVEDRSSVLLEKLTQGDLDAAVLALPVAGGDLVVAPLFREEFVLATPAGHPLDAAPSALAASDLAGEALLLLEDGHCMRDQTLQVCATTGAREQTGSRISTVETLRFLVASGAGITLLPALAVAPPVFHPPTVTLHRFADPAPHRTIALVWRRSDPHDALLGEVAEVLRVLPPGLVHPPEA
ncbi:MAG: LysR substrate-binding domain-containing protein [Propioniciclava sp.]|uniref:LysR substrate-binding domain-containing protein n=1 Tax=Propioniciclava sp. TaxID=2038686 RepID=UPI0039E312D4